MTVRLNDGLDRRVTICTQHSVDARLIARPLGLEPLQNVLIDSQRDGRLWWQRFEPPANHTANDVPNVCFWMLLRRNSGLFDRRRAQSVLDCMEVDLRFALGCFAERDDADFMFDLRVNY